MFDHDPREQDARHQDDGVRDREEDSVVLGRCPTSMRAEEPDREPRHRDEDRRADRDRDSGDREAPRGALEPQDVFLHDLDLPRGQDRDLVHDRIRDYTLNGSESRALSTIGAFRIVSERDLRDSRDNAFDTRHLEDQGLIQRVSLSGQDRAVVLTERGRSLLENHRDSDSDGRQTFYSGADKARERTHDAQLYRAYLNAAERLQDRDARILRVELDRELKREYQRFLQERNRGDRDSNGRPDRTVEEIQEWAREHDLPYFDDQVHFPDVRIEYEDVNGDVRWEDIEVTTEHYRGAHRSAVSRSGFSIYGSGGSGGSAPFDPRAAEEFL
jgi:hypothetical protein